MSKLANTVDGQGDGDAGGSLRVPSAVWFLKFGCSSSSCKGHRTTSLVYPRHRACCFNTNATTPFLQPHFAGIALLDVAGNDQHQKLLELVDDGYRLDKLRAAASDSRFRIVPPVWSSLTVNPDHKAPLRVDGQAGRKKGVRNTKRKTSNGEFATSSRSYANHVNASNSQTNASNSQTDMSSLSQGPSQLSQGAGAMGP